MVKKSIHLFFILILFTGCKNYYTEDKITELYFPYKNTFCEIRITRIDGNVKTEKFVKLWYKKGKIRIDIIKDYNKKDVLIIKQNRLYVINNKHRIIYLYNLTPEIKTTFLKDLFINFGEAKKLKSKYQKDKYFIYEYNMLRNIDGIYMPSNIKIYKYKNKIIKKIIAETKKIKSSGFILEIMKIKYKKIFYLSDKKFKLPGEYKIIRIN